jgi:hypothetical protein
MLYNVLSGNDLERVSVSLPFHGAKGSPAETRRKPEPYRLPVHSGHFAHQ